MPKRAESVKVLDNKISKKSKDELIRREKWEDQLKGTDDLLPELELNLEQSEFYDMLVDKLRPIGVLGSSDTLILVETARIMDMLENVNDEIGCVDVGCDAYFKLAKLRLNLSDKVTSLLKEIGLTPQARNKLAQIKAQ